MDDVGAAVSPVAVHLEGVGAAILGGESQCRFAADNCIRGLLARPYRVDYCVGISVLTFSVLLDNEILLPTLVLRGKCGVKNVEVLLHDVEEEVACHVGDRFAAGDGEVLALDFESSLAGFASLILMDLEAVSGQGENLLCEDETVTAGSDILVKHSHRGMDRREHSCHGYLVSCSREDDRM